MSRTITQGDKRSLRRIIRKHIVRSDRDFGMLRTEYIERVEVDDMAADLVEWADRRALRTAPAPAPSVVPEAAVERAARAMQAENAPKPDPLNRDQREEQDDATIATYRTLTRAALAAALPLLTAAPSATRDEVARALEGEFGCFLARDPHRPDAFWGGAADALLARFTITPKETDTND